MTMRDALAEFGADSGHLAAEAYNRANVVGYLEVHIEQGPVPGSGQRAIGGRLGDRQPGPLPHPDARRGRPMPAPCRWRSRHDALAGAAEVISLAEEVATKGAKASLVATVGDIRVTPGASNVIPGSADFSLDVRAADDATRTAAATDIRQRARQIGARRGLVFGMETVHEKPVRRLRAAPSSTRSLPRSSRSPARRRAN